ncbi:MAG: hypothetical protein K9M56_10205 [Victivallales bacterium]|nr:hypothetical protein [Victivallales bacterium]
MTFKVKKYFNMVEVTLSIGILAIGAIGVLTLFPLGLDKNKSSIGENYCADAAGSMLAYIERSSINSWSDVTGIPSVKKDIKKSSKIDDGFSFVSKQMGTIYEITDVDTEGNTLGISNGIYGIKFATENQDGTQVVDFTGEVQLWRSQISDDINEQTALRVFMEISWPVTTQYRFRKKNYYSLDLYNYNN